MKIKPFGVEIWMNTHENDCTFNIAETCVASLTVEQLLDIAGRKEDLLEQLLPLKLTYGAIEGDAIPESLGAHVDVLWLREENGFLPDLDELAELVVPV